MAPPSSKRSLLGKIRPPIPPRSDQPVPEIIGVLRDMPRSTADETRTGDITSARTGVITNVVTPESNTVNPATNNTSTMSTMTYTSATSSARHKIASKSTAIDGIPETTPPDVTTRVTTGTTDTNSLHIVIESFNCHGFK